MFFLNLPVSTKKLLEIKCTISPLVECIQALAILHTVSVFDMYCDVLHKPFCACTDLSFQADEQQWNHRVRGE